MKLRSRYCLTLLVLIVLVIYYPAIHAPLNPMDDRAIVTWLINFDFSSIQSIFRGTTDYYFRPVLLASYLMDMYLWGAETSFMHLDNVLIHSVNTVLVFAVAVSVYPRMQIRSKLLPFLAALFFAIHPVNCEPVNWIAGRSDLLAGTFVLLSFLLLVRGLDKINPYYAWLAFLMLIPGAFSKETAVFFIPAAVLIILYFPIAPDFKDAGGLIIRAVNRFRFLIPFFGAPLFFLFFRMSFLHSSSDSGMSLLRHFIGAEKQLFPKIKLLLTGTGFYAGKLFFPYPLNFTISQIPEQFIWLGVLVVIMLVCMMRRMDLSAAIFLSCAIIASSALLVLLIRPAWTPAAERYLYIPSAFFSLAISSVCFNLLVKIPSKAVVSCILVIFFSSTAIATVQRNLLWQDNVALFRDSVTKSPDFPFAKSVLADLLKESGEHDEARSIIIANSAPEGLRNADFLDLKRAELLIEERRPLEAKAMIIRTRKKDGQLYFLFEQLLVKVNEDLLNNASADEKLCLIRELISVNNELYDAYRDPFYYYRLGQLYLQIPDKVSAARYFSLAQKESPPDSHYKKAAERLADRLSKP